MSPKTLALAAKACIAHSAPMGIPASPRCSRWHEPLVSSFTLRRRSPSAQRGLTLRGDLRASADLTAPPTIRGYRIRSPRGREGHLPDAASESRQRRDRPGDAFDPRRRAWRRHAGHAGHPSGSGDQEAFRRQLFVDCGDRRARDAELCRQRPGGRCPRSRRQRAVGDLPAQQVVDSSASTRGTSMPGRGSRFELDHQESP